MMRDDATQPGHLSQPEPPTSATGEHPAMRQRCDAPGCVTPTTWFIRSIDRRAIIHFCEAHKEWAIKQSVKAVR